MIRINGVEVPVTRFPNGESLIRIDDILENILLNKCDVTFKFENNGDLIDLMFVAKELKNYHVRRTRLTILYMPYSRMDRTEGVNAFTLKYVSEFINSLGFDRVEVLEPHSDVTTALLDRVEVVKGTLALSNDTMLDLNFGVNKSDVIVYPDQGAAKRYGKEIEFDNVIIADKERDFKTGNIKNVILHGHIPDEPFRAIIVDDLCSRGGTFILTAKKLREMGAKEIFLVVTHCEDTIYDGEVLTTDLIDRVYTTNSILTKYDSNKIVLTRV